MHPISTSKWSGLPTYPHYCTNCHSAKRLSLRDKKGYFDMTAYSAFHDGVMSDYIPTDADLQKGFDGLPAIPGVR